MARLFRVLTAVPIAGLLLFMLAGCEQWPADPRASLANIHERGTLRVGVVEHVPWVTLGDDTAPGGLEGQLVAEFAGQLGVDVDWHRDGVEQQIEALKNFELDLLIGGFSAANPWQAEVAQTFVYFSEHSQPGALADHVMLSTPGENALLMELERFLFTRQDPQRYRPHLHESRQP
ncbi:transporter substrate-binding domain-containing protein [Halopseudomonas xiamenensis]|uniref:transporter substrate-binding domain-containing protein n=1 Tax=Halopseudomonas xiamenensis TaxID=157792 RepID=UPI00162A3A85|nr:transporter substrate-binding domain-containing protein [Halopseudomonas xiamenensis]